MPGSKIVYMGNVDRDEDGLNLATATDEQIRHIRGNEISMIFQEPMSSLNPVITVGDQIMENILTHEEVSKEEAKQRAIDLLAEVGISRPEKVVDNYLPIIRWYVSACYDCDGFILSSKIIDCR